MLRLTRYIQIDEKLDDHELFLRKKHFSDFSKFLTFLKFALSIYAVPLITYVDQY